MQAKFDFRVCFFHYVFVLRQLHKMLTEKNPRKQKQKVADSECDSLTLSSHTASLMATTLIKPVPGDSDLVI